ncbi:unnamed protein product [Prorocentrum cordatum]|uniref:Transmembrane protein 231 n=1 Tax=Prorocentrum cordatum TaxID=2364126 RepID=A0ABN9Y6V5_9DINO|nr:unnamed protein product [Polarella glacialis]
MSAASRPRRRAAAPLAAACRCLLLAAPASAVHQPSPAGGLELGQFRGSALSRQLFARAVAEDATALSGDEKLLEPMDNDTVTADYWSKVDRAILNASTQLAPAATAQDSLAAAPAEKYEEVVVFHPSVHSTYQNVDIPDKLPKEGQSSYDWSSPLPAFRTHLGSMNNDTGDLRELVLEPYNMQLGAAVINSISRKNPATPPPSQLAVNEAYTAQCPMVMFGKSLYVAAPDCSDDLSTSMGTWQDQAKSRTIMRWQGNGAGGVRFNVDSKVSGDGSVRFAEISELMTLNKYLFSLTNCLGTPSFMVEESIIKADKFGRGATTAADHDLSVTTQAFFYKYSIKNPSTGETVAETSLYRADTHQVNITVVQEGSLEGSASAVATRAGAWGVTGCSKLAKGWDISFPTSAAAFDTVATVHDLRVASAVVVTLMAFRDQAIASDGLQRLGQVSMLTYIVKSVVMIFFGILMLYVLWEYCHSRGVDKKLRRVFFKLEATLLPQRPVAREWDLPIKATW